MAAALDGLAGLIAAENPYINGAVDDMDMYVLAASGNSGLSAAQQAASQIDLEMDGSYPGTWDFKGVPQKLSKVLRIKYRYKVPGSNASRWRSGYLLIGFEDGGAG
jgi:hypothetical protein